MCFVFGYMDLYMIRECFLPRKYIVSYTIYAAAVEKYKASSEVDS